MPQPHEDQTEIVAGGAHAGTHVGQSVLEEFIAGEVLEVRVLHPAIPDLLVGQGVACFGMNMPVMKRTAFAGRPTWEK